MVSMHFTKRLQFYTQWIYWNNKHVEVNFLKKIVPVLSWDEPLYISIVEFHGTTKLSILLNNRILIKSVYTKGRFKVGIKI